MTRICLDPATAAKLSSAIDGVELCDEAGNLLGRFMPDERSPAVREWLRTLDHGLSQEEIERRAKSRTGISTAELIKRLRSGQA